MKIPSFRQGVDILSNTLHKIKINKKQAKIDKLVKIDDVHQKETYQVLSEAKEVIANYADANKVRVSFHSFPENKTAAQMKNQMYLLVSRGDIHQVKIIPTEIAKTYAKEVEKKAILEKKNGDKYLASGKFFVEDNFLRNIYRSIEELTKYFSKK